ncbi:hypothetical protein ScalyP_jg5978 [Parmales sp. scaly parma]|nr:hypothetical protein ScalyP_jg5978 [Parmales sp. scaly parma]
MKIALASMICWAFYHWGVLVHVGVEPLAMWLCFSCAYFFLSVSFVAAAVRYKAVGFNKFLPGQIAKLLMYTLVTSVLVGVALGIGAPWASVIPSVSLGIYTGEIAHQLQGQGGSAARALSFCNLPRATLLAGLLGFVYLIVFFVMTVYIWAVIAVENEDIKVAITGVAYPLLVVLIKIIFHGALNKAWSSQTFVGNKADEGQDNCANSVALNEEYSFSSPLEGKKWLAFIYTCRNFGIGLKLVNYFLVLTTMANQPLTRFIVNAGSTVHSTISASLGIAASNRANDGEAAVGAPGTRIVLDKLPSSDKAAHKFVNEDMGELAAIVIAILISVDVLRTVVEPEVAIKWTELVTRGVYILVAEILLDTVKVICLHEPLGIRSSRVDFEVGLWDVGNSAMTVSVGCVIWGTLLAIN